MNDWKTKARNERNAIMAEMLEILKDSGVKSARFNGRDGMDQVLQEVEFHPPIPPIPEREPGDETPTDESGDGVAAAAEALANRGNRKRETP